MIEKLHYKRCTLCQGCINICPKNCIKLDFFKEEFNYPVIDKDDCINCGACGRVCPVLNPLELHIPLKESYAGINKNEDERLKSSSGGIFTALAQSIIEDDGVVFGAAFDENFQVTHIMVEDEFNIHKVRGSKYAQSNTKNIFNDVKNKLIDGKTVLFSGCPCQVGGLNKFLGKEYKNLFTMDFICHGIPSQNTFNEYIKILENKYKSKVKSISFRDKEKGWNESSINIKFENENVYSNVITEDIYMRGYFGNIYLKPACYNCEFRNFKSRSDITLGDYWGAEIEEKDIYDNKGISAVIINTEKGNILKNKIENKCILRPTDYNKILKYNHGLEESFSENKMRNKFFELSEIKSYDKAFYKICKEKNHKKFIRITRSKLGKLKRLVIK